MANPYKTLKVYVCRFGHAYPNWYSNECYDCAVLGRKARLLTATISKIKYIPRWKTKEADGQ